MKTYAQFKQDHPIGSSVAKPFPPYDYRGECVSYGLAKAVEVDGVPFNAPMGHASQIPFNPTFLKYYEQVTDPIEGDLMFWGDDPGNFTGPEGHMAVADTPGYMMNQNYGGSREISRNKVFLPGFIGYFRLKGADMVPDQDNYYQRLGVDLALRIRGRALSREEFKNNLVGQNVLKVVEILSDDPEAQTVQRWQDVGRRAVEENWETRLASAGASEDSKKLQVIKDALGIK